MVGKLFKLEIKSTARVFLPLFAALLFMALLNRVTHMLGGFFSGGDVTSSWLVMSIYAITAVLYALLLVAVCVIVVLVMVQRFYKNLLGDEGYLMLTLPVPSWSHIVVKGVAASLWTIASIVAVLLSVFIMAPADFSVAFTSADWQTLSQTFGLPMPLLALEFFALLFISTFCSMLPIYNAIAIGQFWSKHRIIGSFAAYLAINTIWQVVTVILMFVAFAMERMGAFGFLRTASAAVLTQLFLSGLLVYTLVQGGVHFWLTNYILSKRLNLE